MVKMVGSTACADVVIESKSMGNIDSFEIDIIGKPFSLLIGICKGYWV